MTRARTAWLAALGLGLVVSFALRTPKKPRSAPEPRTVASAGTRSADDTREYEIEIADPSALGLKPMAPASAEPAMEAGEAELLGTLRETWQREPERALALAAEGDRRFGDGPHAVERRLYEIKALVTLGRIGTARTKAERYLEAYPGGPMTDEVSRLTGVHRHPTP